MKRFVAVLAFFANHAVVTAFAPRTCRRNAFINQQTHVWKNLLEPTCDYGRSLYQSTASTADDSLLETKSSASTTPDTDLPWTDSQEYALRDHLPRYTIPGKQFALWRTMTKEVTELCGYPIEFLQQRVDSSTTTTVPKLLPLLEQFDFHANGGVVGVVYGMDGVADGKQITTPTVVDVHLSVPKGYVQTEQGMAYELGAPLRRAESEQESGGYSLDGTLTKAVTNNLVDSDNADMDMLAKIGVSTAVLFGSAAAFGMLSHHLTVNVFWV